MNGSVGEGPATTTPRRGAPASRTLFTDTFRALRTRNFRLFAGGFLVSNTGNWLNSLALTLFVLELSDNGAVLGLLTACQFGPMLVLTAWAGGFADRVDKRRALIVTQTVQALQSGALAVIAFVPDPSLVVLFAVALLGGVALAVDNPLRRTFLSEMVPTEDLPNATALYLSIVNVTRVIGPALAAVLVELVGFGWCFAIDAATYAAVIAALVLIDPRRLTVTPRRPHEARVLRAGVRYAWREPQLRLTLVMTAVIGLFATNLIVMLPLLVRNSLGGGDRVFTVLYVALSVGSVVGGLGIARVQHVGLPLVLGTSLGFGVTLTSLAAAPSPTFAVPAVVAVGASSAMVMMTTTTLVQVRSQPAMRSRLLGLQMVLIVGAAPLAAPLLGLLADAIGGRAPIAIGGAVTLLATAAAFVAMRREGAGVPARSTAG